MKKHVITEKTLFTWTEDKVFDDMNASLFETEDLAIYDGQEAGVESFYVFQVTVKPRLRFYQGWVREDAK